MKHTASPLPFRTNGIAVLAVILAIVIAMTGFEAAAHSHLPPLDGWHDQAPHEHGTGARDEGLGSCSICRLAHETASGPVAPGTVPEPLRLNAPRPDDRVVLDLAHVDREHSPRAPPCPTSC